MEPAPINDLPMEIIYEILDKIPKAQDRVNFVISLGKDYYKFFNAPDDNGFSILDKMLITKKTAAVLPLFLYNDNYGDAQDLVDAILEHSLPKVQAAIDRDPRVLYTISKKQNSALHLAVLFSRKYPEILTLILQNMSGPEKSMIINHPNKQELNPLFTAILYASSITSLSAIEQLVDNGADINYKNVYHLTPVTFYISMVVKELIPISVLRFLVNRGADLTIVDNQNKTALEIAQKLLNRWQDPYSIDFIMLDATQQETHVKMYQKIVDVLEKK